MTKCINNLPTCKPWKREAAPQGPWYVIWPRASNRRRSNKRKVLAVGEWMVLHTVMPDDAMLRTRLITCAHMRPADIRLL